MSANQRAQIAMTDDEIHRMFGATRTISIATIGPRGLPHVAAMWFGYLDGRVYLETKSKSQKVVNLRRDPAIGALVEAGNTYDELRGVSVEGTATILDDPADPEFRTAMIDVYQRYLGEYSHADEPRIAEISHNRVVVRIDPVHISSWDHRKLGGPIMPIAGSTAPFAR